MSTLTKILHVEDDEDILEIAEMALNLLGGFEVAQANRGAKALEILEEFDPQLILIDVQMPGLTGPETLAAIWQTPGYENIPAIFMTAKLREDNFAELMGAGVLSVISKPFDPTTLADQIRAIWDAAQS